MPRQPLELGFPFRGIDEGWAFRKPQAGTSPDAKNVRPIGSDERVRGGQRDGLSKYLDSQVNGSNAVQFISYVTRPTSVSNLLTGGLLFSEDCENSISSGDFQAYHAAGSAHPGTLSTTGGHYTVSTVDGGNRYQAGSSGYFDAILWKTEVTTAGTVLLCTMKGTTAHTWYAGLIIRADHADSNLSSTEFGEVLFTNGNVYLYLGNSLAGSAAFTFGASERTIRVVDSGTVIHIYADDTLVLTVNDATLGTNGFVGFFVYRPDSNNFHWVDNIILSEGIFSEQPPERRLLVVSNGALYHGTHDDGLSAATDATGGFATGRVLRGVEAYTKYFFADGTSGYKTFDPATDTVTDWSADSGTLPVGDADNTLGCSIIALYRGRVVLSGLSEFPNEWYMSAVGDPLDWDYSATATGTEAIYGSNSDAGQLGDVVRCLMPFSDDILVMGGAQSLWLMRGDPAAGGSIDSISYQVGIGGPDAATWDSDGNLYFYGTGGIWRLQGGASVPQSLTDTRLKQKFEDFDLTTYRIVLTWDRRYDGLHVFKIPSAFQQPTTAPTHWFWDRRTDSWWLDEFPATMGPSAVAYYPADTADDRAMLLGGWDGYLRFMEEDQADDDGTVISSYVDFTPILIGGDLGDTRLSEVAVTMDRTSGNAMLKVFGEATPSALAVTTTPKIQRPLVAGRNASLRQRLRANAIRFQMQNVSTGAKWTMESMTAYFDKVGRARRR